MKFYGPAALCLALTVYFVTGFSSAAHAYIDLGTGSMIFQMIVAGFVGLTFTIKMYWFKIKAKIKQLMGQGDAEAAATTGLNKDNSDDGHSTKN